MGAVVRLFPQIEGRRGLGPHKRCRPAVAAGKWLERAQASEDLDRDAAIHAYRRGLAGLPDASDAHCNLGRLLHDRGDLAGAESHYRLALCRDRGSALFWFNLGVVVEDSGRGAEAMAAYREAIACDGRFADAHFNLAGLLERAGDLHSARQAVHHLSVYRAIRRTA